jgi:trigger factor
VSELKVSVQDVSPVEKRLEVTVPAPVVDQAYEAVLANLRRTAKIKGFRPGKVPREMIEKIYGQQIGAEVASEAIKRTYFEALKDHDVRAISQPVIDNALAQRGAEFKYTATVEVLAPVELKQFRGLPLKKIKTSVPPAQVDKAIEQILDSRATLSEVTEERSIKNDDFAVIDLTTHEGGKKVPEMSAEGFTVPVGGKVLFPELDEALVGMKVGEEKTITVTVPEEAADKRFAGRTLELQFQIKGLKAKVRPELTDEFAKELGDVASADELRSKVLEDMTRHMAEMSERQLRESALTELIDKNPLDVSPGLVDREADELVHRALHDYEQRGVKPEQLDRNRLRSELRPAAERRIRTELLLDAIADKEKVTVGEEAINAYYQREAERANASIEDVRQAHAHMRDRLLDRLRLDEALQLVIREAKVEEIDAPEPGAA